jgi:ArsR family transcriptional regulator
MPAKGTAGAKRARKALSGLPELFKALSDPIRLRILALLRHGEVCVCHIHEALDVPQPTASRHLAYLRRAGLVATRRTGLWVNYRLAEPQDPVLATIVGAVAHGLTHVDAPAADTRRLSRIQRLDPQTEAPFPVPGCCCADRGQGEEEG